MRYIEREGEREIYIEREEERKREIESRRVKERGRLTLNANMLRM